MANRTIFEKHVTRVPAVPAANIALPTGAVLESVVARYRGIVKRLYFRGDAAFANAEMYEFHGAECMGYKVRLTVDDVLQSRSAIC